MAGTMEDDRGPQIEAVTYAMLILATMAVALRLWARYITPQVGFWWDDWLSLAALPFVWASCALSIYWVHIGLGRHISEIRGTYSQMALILFVENFVYNAGLSLVKMSVLLFYMRLFGTVRVYRCLFWIAGFLVVALFIAITFVALFMCAPIHKHWQPTVPGHCLDSQACFLGATISNVVIDFILLVLPVPILWRINVKVSRKAGLVGVFAAGYCVIILSILRLISITNLKDELQYDISWNLTTPQILVTCEVPVALISSCLPLIFTLIKHGAQRLPTTFKWNASKRMRGLRAPYVDPTGSLLDQRNTKGFVHLSQERLFDNTTQTEADCTMKSSPRLVRENQRRDAEMGIPLHQFRVTEDSDSKKKGVEEG